MNRFDYSLILIFILMLFGLYGGGLQPIRVFVIFFAVINIRSILLVLNMKSHRYFGYLSIIIAFYSIASSFFIPANFSYSFLTCIYFIINILLVVNLICCFEFAKKPLNSSQIGSFIFCFIAIGCGIYEILMGAHLPVNLVNLNNAHLRAYSSFTFGNYNSFILALLANIPIIAYSLVSTKNTLFKITSLLLLLAISYIILINGSRLGLIGLVLTAGYILFSTKKVSTKIFILLMLIIPIIYFIPKFETLMYRIENLNPQNDCRFEIFSQVVSSFLDNGMFGYGIGNFTYYIENNFSALCAHAPHNFFLEIIFGLGLFPFLLVAFLFIKIIAQIKNMRKEIGMFLSYMLVLFVPFSILNSGYLTTAVVWLFVGFIYSVAFCMNFKLGCG